MVIIPDSKVILIKNPLKLDTNNEMMFANASAQETYFKSLPKLEFDDLTYVRKDGVLRIPTDETASGTTYEDLLQYNFCMYQNTHFDNKWFYAFITDYKWVSPSMTELKLETAYYQTWQHDLTFADSFIEREHVDNDTIGLHTIPEDLETGEYVMQENVISDIGFNYLSSIIYVVALSDWPFDSAIETHYLYNGVFSGFMYLGFETPEDVYSFIHDIQDETAGDVINSIFMIPHNYVDSSWEVEELVTGASWEAQWIPNSSTQKLLGSYSMSDCHWLDSNYVPKNNKLLCYPYRYLLANNNAGSSTEYRYEWFTNKTTSYQGYGQCQLNIYGAISPGCAIKMFPVDYARNNTNQANNFMYGLDGGKLPTCSWWNDGYTNWLTQNAVNMPLQALGNVVDIAKGGLTGNLGNVASGLGGIANQVGQIYQHSLEPKTGKGGVNQGDLNFAFRNAYYVYKMSIREEYAKVIDDFFSQFGYKVNRLGKPHLHARTYYDYIKTIDVNIEGNVPEPDLNEIRKMFNNGIRFWHDTTKYLDFSVNNTIIS